uniref:Photosystem II protein N n=1 Tax=Medicago sativa subsp. falcata TaxID=3878 RepID=A0A1J0I0G0_MEDSF|nr:photosystem II protein N [Medicago sativa subsp. falcata]APC60465.1 photosystem II protein N [Medicago sativa subsp. falcata]
MVVLILYNHGNSNPNCHLYIWFNCQFYWVCLIYCFWATLSTTKRSIRRTWGLVEVMSLQYRNIGGSLLQLR